MLKLKTISSLIASVILLSSVQATAQSITSMGEWRPSSLRINTCDTLLMNQASADRVRELDPEFVAQQIAHIEAAEANPHNVKLQDLGRAARAELGLVTATEAQQLKEMLASSNEKLDDVLFANSLGFSNGGTQLVPDNRGTELVVADEQLPFQTLYLNILNQLSASGLFTGFSDPEFKIGGQYLKIKPIEQWSEQAKRAFDIIMPYHDSTDKRNFADSWFYSYFSGHRDVNELAGLPAVAVTYEMGFHLKQMSPNALPLSQNVVKRAGSNFETAVLAAGFYPRRPNRTYNEGMGPTANFFFIPAEIIDWEKSFFSIYISRPVPQRSLLAQYHTVEMMVTQLGKEIVLTGATSGKIREASASSRPTDNLPQHWNEIPQGMRQIPKGMDGLNKYLDWLKYAQFGTGNRLGEGSTRGPRLLGN